MSSARRADVISKKLHPGFTMTELLVVMSIIGILASTIVVGLRASRNKARVAKAKSEMKFYGLAVEEYRSRNLYSAIKWPDTPTADTTCSDADKYPVPSVLIDGGLWKEGECSDYQYYYDTVLEEVGIRWPGLDGQAGDIARLGEFIKSDDLLLIISSGTDTDRIAEASLMKKNVFFQNKID